MTWSAHCLQCEWKIAGSAEEVDRESRRHSGEGKMRGATHHATATRGEADGRP